MIVQENYNLFVKQKGNYENKKYYLNCSDYLNREYDIDAPTDLDLILRLKNKLQVDLENKIKKEKQILEKQDKTQESVQQFDTAEEAINARMNLSKEVNEPTSKAQIMMEQMGWQSGKGLGKEEQGMINPLIAKKQK